MWTLKKQPPEGWKVWKIYILKLFSSMLNHLPFKTIESERERERERDRQTDRQTDRERKREGEREFSFFIVRMIIIF